MYNLPLPWVESYKHLGHILHIDESMSHDLLKKRTEFISSLHALRHEIGNQDPDVFMSLVYIYLISLYGSNLWDLYSTTADSLYSTWNIMIKNNYNLPYPTHRYISQELFCKPHIRICLRKRFIKFYGKLKICSKPQVTHLFNIQKYDFRSIFGRNCLFLCSEMNVTRVEDIDVKTISMPEQTEEQEAWRVPFLKDLISLRDGKGGTDIPKTDIQDVINFICCN